MEESIPREGAHIPTLLCATADLTLFPIPYTFNALVVAQIAPYTTLLINGAGWQPGFPRLMTNDQLATALRASRTLSPHGRFRTVADVSCDVKGGLEFVERSTTVRSPAPVQTPNV